MRLHSPAFEKSLKRAVRKRVKASRELRKRASEGVLALQRLPENFLFHIFGVIGVIASVFALKAQGYSPALQLAIVSLLSLSLCFYYISSVYRTLYNSADLPAFAFLPIQDVQIFRWQWQRVVRRSVWFAIYAFIGYTAFAVSHETGWLGVGAAAVAAYLQWLTMFSLAVGIAAFRPTWFHNMIGFVLMSPLLIMFLARKYVPDAAVEWMDAHAYIVNFVLPSGWISQLFGQIATGFQPAILLLVPLLAGIFHLGRTGRTAIASAYTFTEIPDNEDELYEEMIPVMADEDTVSSSTTEPLSETAPDAPPPLTWRRAGLTDYLDSLQTRAFLKAQPLEASGWMERLFRRWLTSRESLLMEVFFGALPSWTKRWRNGLVVAIIGMVLGYLLAGPNSGRSIIAFLVSGGISVLCIIPAGGDFNRFFSPYMVGTSSVPFLAGFPIGYRDIRRLILKTACVRLLGALPLLTVFGGVVGHVMFRRESPDAWMHGALIGFKFSLLLLLIQPIICSSHFSRGMTPRSGHVTAKTLIYLFLAVMAILLLASTVTMLFIPDIWAFLIGTGITAGISLAIEAVYARQFNRNKSDLQVYQSE